MNSINPTELYKWCKIPYHELEKHPDRKVPFRLVKDSQEMSLVMAHELVNIIKDNNRQKEITRAIIPCGPAGWYKPFTELVNKENVSLRNLVVFHMDECLDWQGKELPIRHPYNFRSFMEKHFYSSIKTDLSVSVDNRHWLNANNINEVSARILDAPIDVTFGGWGQDGHIAYNQARRHPFSHVTIDDVRNSTIRVQENNLDTIIALAQRTFGSAYQFVPPMSVTLGIKECLSAKKVRLYSDTGSWKQTALRVALFSPVTTEYPLTLCQEHPDTLLTATVSTATHPISENEDWDLGFND
jgi:glucosamine-6-phosphate deaminase